MQGVHAFDPTVKTTIDLESVVAEGHFLRQIDRVLDLSFVRELTAACYADGKVALRSIRKFSFACSWWRTSTG
jgi:hypothetical protein